MNKKYTRRQICEAIKHWQKQLKQMDESFELTGGLNLCQYAIESNKEHGDVIDGKFYLSQTFTSEEDLIAELNDKYDFEGWLRIEPGVEDAVDSNDELFDFLLDDDIVEVNNDATGESIVIQIQAFAKPYWLDTATAIRQAARAARTAVPANRAVRNARQAARRAAHAARRVASTTGGHR